MKTQTNPTSIWQIIYINPGSTHATIFSFISLPLKVSFFSYPASTVVVKWFHQSSFYLHYKIVKSIPLLLIENFFWYAAPTCTIQYFHQSSFCSCTGLSNPSSFKLQHEIFSFINQTWFLSNFHWTCVSIKSMQIVCDTKLQDYPLFAVLWAVKVCVSKL